MATEKFRVVAVDDDKDILELIQLALHDKYEIVTVQDSSTALDLIDLCEPDAVITDIMMPKVTGYTILEYIRNSSRHQQTIVAFLTAKDNPRDIKYGYKLGANLYLTKPFQPERLVRALHVLLADGGHHPRTKSLSARDIQLRQQLKLGLTTSPLPGPRAAGESSGFGLLPPSVCTPNPARHAEEEGEDPDTTNRTTWVG